MGFKFEPVSDTSGISQKELFVGGIIVNSFFISEKTNPFDYVESTDKGKALKLLFLMHGRTRSSELYIPLAHKILSLYTNDDEPLIIFTFDHRNHGTRQIDPLRNKTWKDGNETHAADMLSFVNAGASDLKSIVDYLPGYIPLLSEFQIKRYVSGVSLGAHAAIRAAARYPETFKGAISILGTFDLSSLLLNRLHDFNQVDLFKSSYESFRSHIDSSKYSQGLFEQVSKEDLFVLENYDSNKIDTFNLFGESDPLVPLKYSLSFLNNAGVEVKYRDDIDFASRFQAIKYDAQHDTTEEMVQDVSVWLSRR